jgi:hypothetical protein
MKTEELLDRLELLYPSNLLLADLRKAVLNEDRFALFRVIKHINDTPLTEAIRKFEKLETFDTDSLSRGQIKSKKWLIDELEKLDLNLGTVFLCAGWYATLAAMLFESTCKIEKIRSFDVDPTCVDVADTINANNFKNSWRFKAILEDIHKINYSEHSWSSWSNANNRMSYPIVDIPTTIINTSCEHIEKFSNWFNSIPSGKIVILQTNNYFEIADHINCSSSLEEFATSTPMTEVLYQGELQLPKYNRFMRIGIK